MFAGRRRSRWTSRRCVRRQWTLSSLFRILLQSAHVLAFQPAFPDVVVPIEARVSEVNDSIHCLPFSSFWELVLTIGTWYRLGCVVCQSRVLITFGELCEYVSIPAATLRQGNWESRVRPSLQGAHRETAAARGVRAGDSEDPFHRPGR